MEDRREEKIPSKDCPQCGKPNVVEARICTCGHWFAKKAAVDETDGFSHDSSSKTNQPAAGAEKPSNSTFASLPGFIAFASKPVDEPAERTTTPVNGRPPEPRSSASKLPPAASGAVNENGAPAIRPNAPPRPMIVKTENAPVRRGELELLADSAYSPAREKLKRNVRKTLAVACFVIFAGVAAAVLTGYTDYFENSEELKKRASLAADENDAADPAETATRNRLSKGRIDGLVAAVASGDRITVTDQNSQQYQIKLGDIVAPSIDEPFGPQSRDHLASLILNKNVLVNLQKIGEDGTLVGKIVLDGVNVNLEQIKAGFARHDPKGDQFEEDRLLYAKVESDAKASRTGFWAAGGSPPAVAEPAAEEKLDFAAAAPPAAPPARPSSATETSAAETSENPRERPANDAATPDLPFSQEPNVGAETRRTAAPTGESPVRTAPVPVETQTPKPAPPSPRPTPEVAAAPKTKGGRTYYLGPRGGCYYLTASGNKAYVDRSMCN